MGIADARTASNAAISLASISARTLSTLLGRSTARNRNANRGSAYFAATASRLRASARRTAICSAVGPDRDVLIGTGLALNGSALASTGGAGRGRLRAMLNGSGTVTDAADLRFRARFFFSPREA